MTRMEISSDRPARPGPSSAVQSRLERLIRDARRFAPGDHDDLRRFHEEMFGEGCRQTDEARFRWLYEEPPDGSPTDPSVWIIRKNDRIVGEQAGIRHRLKVGDEEHRASWAIDLIVHPEWRLRGVGPALSEVHSAEYDLVVAAGATDLAYPTYLRLGWHDLGGIPFLLKPIDLGLLLSMRLVVHHLVMHGMRLVSWGIRASDAARTLNARHSVEALEFIPRFDERVNSVWEACSPSYPVIARRDFTSLRWRFDHPVPADRYERAYFVRDGAVRGYAVVRRGFLLGAPMGFITDYLCAPEETNALLSACADHLRQFSVAGVVCETLNPALRSPLRRAGFLRIRRRVNRRLLWKAGGGRAPDAGLLDDPRNWFITRADGDSDHPDPRVDRE